MKTIFLIMGESGSGKDSVVNALCERYGYKKLKSYTTRERRTPDEDTHTFVTNRAFDELRDMVAWTNYGNHRYCATADQVDESDLYIIDPDGVRYFKNHYHRQKRIFIIYLKTEMTTRMVRMLRRGDSVKQAVQRLKLDRDRFSGAAVLADKVVENKDFETCVATIAQIMETNKE